MATTTANQGQWLTINEVADRYRVSVETVRYWRKTGVLTCGHRLGRHLRFREVDLAAWENAHADRKATG